MFASFVHLCPLYISSFGVVSHRRKDLAYLNCLLVLFVCLHVVNREGTDLTCTRFIRCIDNIVRRSGHAKQHLLRVNSKGD